MKVNDGYNMNRGNEGGYEGCTTFLKDNDLRTKVGNSLARKKAVFQKTTAPKLALAPLYDCTLDPKKMPSE